jgi:CelD/BcsL family acetyltransferase involved in cellulose biosynthesis
MIEGMGQVREVNHLAGEDGLTVRVIHRMEAVPGQGKAWNSLVNESIHPCVFLRWEWISTWWKWFGDERAARLYLVYDRSRLVGILPLYARHTLWCARSRRVILAPIGVGGPTYPEYLGLIVHRDSVDAVVERLSAELQSPDEEWGIIELPDVAPDDQGTLALAQCLRGRFPSISRSGESTLAFTLPRSFDDLIMRLSAHGRARERRKLRRAVKECQAQLRVIDSSSAVDAFQSTLVALSKSSRARTGDVSPFQDEKYCSFHRDVMHATGQSGLLRLFVLNLDNKPSAFMYGFVYSGKYYDFQKGFDADASRFSPGDVVCQMAFQWLIGENVVEFDYLRGDESYKRVFSDRERSTTTFHIFRGIGLPYFCGWTRTRIARPARGIMKRWLERWRMFGQPVQKSGR